MKIVILSSIIVFAITGCASAPIISSSALSSATNCPSNEIKITNEKFIYLGMDIYLGLTEWTAECRGKIYYCNFIPGGDTKCSESN